MAVGAGRPAWGWRLLAWLTAATIGLMSVPALLAVSLVGLIGIVPAWLAVAGLLAYAYGRPARPLAFWRLFAPILSLYIMWDLGGYLGRMATIRLNGAEIGGPTIATLAFWLPLNVFACIGLLRHAEILRGRQRLAKRELESVFA